MRGYAEWSTIQTHFRALSSPDGDAMAPRVGLLLVGHPDYPNAVGARVASEAAQALRAHGIEVLGGETVCTDVVLAAFVARQLLRQDVEGVILFLATWIECATALAAIREIEHLPFALWAFPMYEEAGRRESTGSFVAACALQPALRRMDYRFPTILGMPGDDAAMDRALSFCRAAHATERLKRTRVGLVGYSAMAIYPGTFDHVLLRRHIGPEVVHLDTYTLVRLAEAAPAEAVATSAEALAGACRIEVAQERLLKASRLTWAARELVRVHHLHALNVKCQYELSQEWGMTACVPMATLADEGVVASCEGDTMVTVSQVLLHYLTGTPVTYGDLLDLQGPQALISACGFAPLSMASQEPAPAIRELDYPGFDGIICSLTLRQGPVTLARLAEERGSYRLVYALGQGEQTQLRQGRFPALTVTLAGDPQRLLDNIPSQHFALCPGHLEAELEEVARILNIPTLRV